MIATVVSSRSVPERMDVEGGDLLVPDDSGDVVGSVGTVLLMLHEAKKDIRQDIKERSEQLHKDLAERIDAMSNTVVRKVISGVSSQSYLGRAGSSRCRSSAERKRNAPPPPDRLQYLSTVVEKDKTSFLVQ